MPGRSRKKKQDDEYPDRSTIVPRIKHRQFLKALREMDVPKDQMPVTEPLVADLLVTYAFDLPGMFQMVTYDAMKVLGIAPKEFRQLALTNLKRQLPKIGIATEEPLRRIVTGENLEACVLLATRFWNDVAGQTEGDVVAVVPSRDLILFCSSKSREGIGFLRAAAELVLSSEGTHALSKQLLTWRNGTWAKYNGSARKPAGKKHPKRKAGRHVNVNGKSLHVPINRLRQRAPRRRDGPGR
jgi:uncharacterized protein YtpQ (UPF0354 family)